MSRATVWLRRYEFSVITRLVRREAISG